MRYRALTATGDYTFGQNGANWLVDTAAAVQQAISTRLKLFQGEWFLDTSQGTPWYQSIVGNNPEVVYDQAVKDIIINTQGVQSLDAYSSVLNPTTRTLTIVATVTTIYSANAVAVNETLNGNGA